jgi:hypothetical protein
LAQGGEGRQERNGDGRKPNGEVDKQAVEFNLRVLTSSERLRITPYDRQSIMHYYFEPELFKRGLGVTVLCRTQSNAVKHSTNKWRERHIPRTPQARTSTCNSAPMLPVPLSPRSN